jgi:Pectate lyase superfamily protein
MRSDLESNRSRDLNIISGKLGTRRQKATGDIVLNDLLPNSAIDPNGADRNVTLPPLEAGLFFLITNVGIANTLTVKDSNAVTIEVLSPGEGQLFYCDGFKWFRTGVDPGSIIGVFGPAGPSHSTGLVPDPGPVAGLDRALFDDGTWKTITSSGAVDAYKQISDGTTVAIAQGLSQFKLRSSSGAVTIVVAENDATHGDNANFGINASVIPISGLSGYDANKFIDHTAVTITAGGGLSGGGDISASRTINLDLNDLTADTPVLSDTLAFYDVSGADTNKATFTALNAILDHNSLLNYSANRHIDHTTVSINAGTGLSGGGDISSTRTLSLDLNSLVVDTPIAGDFIPFFDTSGADTNKAAVTGSGNIVLHTSPQFNVDIRPVSNGAASLGISGTAWSNAFFMSGAVLNFGAGTTTLTQSAPGLTLAGGSLKVPDDPYNATLWDGNLEVPTKNAIRDKIEAMVVGGGGSPGGSDTQVQFNDGGSFGGDARLIFAKTTGEFTASTTSSGGTARRTLQQHFGDELYVEDFGAVGDGIVDDAAAIQAAINQAVAGGGGVVHLGPKSYRIRSTLIINGHAVALEGQGKIATVLSFEPTIDNDIAIDVSNGASIVSWTRLKGFTLYSPETSFTKIGVQASDVDFFEMDDIHINGNVSGLWGGGTGSIGIRMRGRDFISIRDTVQVGAQKPVVISVNPNSTIAFDHSLCAAALVASGFPCITVDTGLYISNSTFSGAWMQGTGGFFYDDTTSGTASFNVKFVDIRAEQQTVSTNYIIYFKPVGCNGVTFENIGLGNATRGIFLRNCANVSIENTLYGSASLEGLNVDTVNSLRLAGTFWQTGSTATLTGLNLIFKGPVLPAGGPLPSTALYATATMGFVTGNFNYQTAVDGNAANFENTSGGALGSIVNLFANSATPAPGDTVGKINYNGKTSTGATVSYASVAVTLNDPTNATYGGSVALNATGGGAAKTVLFYGPQASFMPGADGGASLGIPSFAWSGLLLSSAAEINWNSGQIKLFPKTITGGVTHLYARDAASVETDLQGGWRNFPRVAKTANYTVSNADKGATISASGTPWTLTFSAASGYDADFAVSVVNQSTTRGLLIAASGLASFFLYPGQSALVFNDGGTWAVLRRDRWTLTANLTVYVRSDGNDGNDGLGDNSGGAFLTVQKGLDFVCSLDCNVWNATVQVRAGTYTATNVPVASLKRVLGSGTYLLTGDTTTPANVILNATNPLFLGGGSGSVQCNQAEWNISGFKILATTAGHAINCINGAHLTVTGAMDFGALPAFYTHLLCQQQAVLEIGNVSYTISGVGYTHIVVNTGGIVFGGGGTITFTGAFSWGNGFVNTQHGAILSHSGTTFSGPAQTGKRYQSDSNSVIETFGSGANYFPGSVAGTPAPGAGSLGGIYI